MDYIYKTPHKRQAKTKPALIEQLLKSRQRRLEAENMVQKFFPKKSIPMNRRNFLDKLEEITICVNKMDQNLYVIQNQLEESLRIQSRSTGGISLK